MYTIKEVAQKLDITPQAVYKKLNQLQTELNNHIYQVEKGSKTVKAVDKQGLEILKDSLNQPVDNQVKQPNNQVDNQFKTETMEILRETIDTLNNQIEVKDKQIQQLKEEHKEEVQQIRSDYKEQLKVKDGQIENLTELNRNNQVLLGRGQEQKALPGGTVIDKIKNFFNKEG